ncbi:PE family protein [Mycobacterium tuberculosis variant bovis BCG str. ATCC 35743]|nr:PE family protein [Mycobacterium tuberculosis variant bovis BCG str. ATCC 35743]
MIATPAALTAAATDIDGIGSAVSVANAAAVAATTGVLAAGAMKVLPPRVRWCRRPQRAAVRRAGGERVGSAPLP